MGIFGHGNVTGIGEALERSGGGLLVGLNARRIKMLVGGILGGLRKERQICRSSPSKSDKISTLWTVVRLCIIVRCYVRLQLVASSLELYIYIVNYKYFKFKYLLPNLRNCVYIRKTSFHKYRWCPLVYTQLTPPRERISKDAVKVWLIGETILNAIGFLILAVLFYLDYRYSWKAWAGWILKGSTIILILGSLWTFIHPFFLYKSWRYDVSEEFLQIKSGVLVERHELVPMTKIQSVATKQGPLLRKYGLCSVTLTTMGSSHTIPALPQEIAVQLRSQIVQYAKIKEAES